MSLYLCIPLPVLYFNQRHIKDYGITFNMLSFAVTARLRCVLVKFKKCGKLLWTKLIHLRLKMAVYMSYLRPAILYGSEAWCLMESKITILQPREGLW